MAKPRYAARRDTNHKDVVEWFHQLFCSTVDLSNIGIEDIPDLLIGRYGQSRLIEIKYPGHPPSKRKLRKGQSAFFETWKGCQCRKVETLEDCQRIVDEMKIESIGKLKRDSK